MKIDFSQPQMGMDVEFFLKEKDSIIGSEKFMQSDIKCDNAGKFIKDGVQIEINPCPSHCRALLADNISNCFKLLKQELEKKNINIDFSGTIEVPQKEFDTLSEESKTFGCNPDYSVYNDNKANIKENGQLTRKRTAGGHIHFGVILFNKDEQQFLLNNKDMTSCNLLHIIEKNNINIHLLKSIQILSLTQIAELQKKIIQDGSAFKITPDTQVDYPKYLQVIQNPNKIIPLLDLFVGIPSVLIDRDPGAKARRMQYGKAGDFRYQPHGIEYRTLSNFWLTSYQLMGLFLGLARTAYLVCAHDAEHGTTYCDEFLKLVDQKDIIKAINENDYKLARDIFLKIEKPLCSIGDDSRRIVNYPLISYYINSFKQFVLDGFKQYFKESPEVHWSKVNETHWSGWETFLNSIKVNENTEKEFKTKVLD